MERGEIEAEGAESADPWRGRCEEGIPAAGIQGAHNMRTFFGADLEYSPKFEQIGPIFFFRGI
eukprot:1350243-Amorphochlora_amoeboformis.AAC.1